MGDAVFHQQALMTTNTFGAGVGWQEQDSFPGSSAETVRAGVQGGAVSGKGRCRTWGAEVTQRDQVPQASCQLLMPRFHEAPNSSSN